MLEKYIACVIRREVRENDYLLVRSKKVVALIQSIDELASTTPQNTILRSYLYLPS